MILENCLLCDNFQENMKGKFMIVANEPKNCSEPFSIRLYSFNFLFDIGIMTGSVYIGDTNTKMILFAQANSDEDIESELVIINPNEFNYLELDYEFAENKIKKLILKKIDHN